MDYKIKCLSTFLTKSLDGFIMIFCGLYHFTSFLLNFSTNYLSQYLHVQSLKWKHQKNVWNLFKFNSKDTTNFNDIFLVALLLTLNRSYTSCWCFHYWNWTSKCWLAFLSWGTLNIGRVYWFMQSRSSHPVCSIEKGVFLKIRFQACNFIKKETQSQVFSCEFCKIFKNTFTEHLWTTASFNLLIFCVVIFP